MICFLPSSLCVSNWSQGKSCRNREKWNECFIYNLFAPMMKSSFQMLCTHFGYFVEHSSGIRPWAAAWWYAEPLIVSFVSIWPMSFLFGRLENSENFQFYSPKTIHHQWVKTNGTHLNTVLSSSLAKLAGFVPSSSLDDIPDVSQIVRSTHSSPFWPFL